MNENERMDSESALARIDRLCRDMSVYQDEYAVGLACDILSVLHDLPEGTLERAARAAGCLETVGDALARVIRPGVEGDQ